MKFSQNLLIDCLGYSDKLLSSLMQLSSRWNFPSTNSKSFTYIVLIVGLEYFWDKFQEREIRWISCVSVISCISMNEIEVQYQILGLIYIYIYIWFSLPDGSLMEITKVYPLDAVFDTLDDVPEDVSITIFCACIAFCNGFYVFFR